MRTKEYINFENGFIKGAEALGVDEPFMRGYLKYAQDVLESWVPYVATAEKLSGDPEFRYKLAADIILMGKKDSLEKCAGEGLGGVDWMGMLDSLGKHIGGSSGLGGLLAGGGGGSLIGLLLSKALGISPYLGLLLGGALGGGAGYGIGSGMGGHGGNNIFGQAVPAVQKSLGNGLLEHTPEVPTDQAATPQHPDAPQASDPMSHPPVQPGQAVKPPQEMPPMPPPAPVHQDAPRTSLPLGGAKPPTPGMPQTQAAPATPTIPPIDIPQPQAQRTSLPLGGMSKHNSVKIDSFLSEKAANMGQGDIDDDTIALLQHMLSSERYNQESAAGGQHVTPSQIQYGEPYNKDKGALNRLKDMGAQNPETLMNPPEIKPKFNISDAFGNGHGPQQHVNNSMGAPAQKPMQQAKPGPLGFPGSNLQQGAQQLQKSTQGALKASV